MKFVLCKQASGTGIKDKFTAMSDRQECASHRCVLTKWTCDETLLSKINTEHNCFGLPTTPTLDNTRVRIIASLFSHSFEGGCNHHDKFKSVLDEIGGRLDTIKLDNDFVNSHGVSRFMSGLRFHWVNTQQETTHPC